MKDKNPIIIVGAGITGLTCGYLLTKKGKSVIILEREKNVGGLARSFKYDGFKFDIGPHRFYSSDKSIIKFIKDTIGTELIEIERNTCIYFRRKYYNWPLRVKDLFKISPLIAIESSYDLLKKTKGTANDLKNSLINKYGKTLYNHFFNDFCWKFFQTEPSNIHKRWSFDGIDKAIIDEKININNLKSLLKFTLTPSKASLKFLYPANGIDTFCENLKYSIQKSGGEVYTGAEITKIDCIDNKIKTISSNDLTILPAEVIWTGSLNDLYRLLHFQQTNLKFISLLIFNFEIMTPLKFKFHWCYYPEREITFIRSSIPSNFSRRLVPENKSSLCLEVPCRDNDEKWKAPEKLIDSIIQDFIKTKLVTDIKNIGNIHIEKIKEAYPLYELNYENNLKKVKECLSKIKNLRLAGRSGEFWYNNMDESIKKAFMIVETI